MYPCILYECLCSCWKQDQAMRPAASKILERLNKFRSSLLNKYTMESPSTLSSVSVIFANHIQSLWAVMEYWGRSHNNPGVTKTIKLTSIQWDNVTRLEIKVSFNLLLFS